MPKCLSMPNILWKVENFSMNCKKLSPTIRFMGLKFHMIIFQYVESGGAKLQLNLECQNTSHALKLRPCQFNVDVSVGRNGLPRSMPKSGVYDLTGNEWCIWTEFVPNIHKNLGQISDLTFLVKITPSGDLGALLQSTKECDGGITEMTPCVVSLREDFGSLFKDGESSDFTLKCGDRSFRVHKAILSARSLFFAGMFRSDMKEATENDSKIEKVEPDTLQIVLHYIYTGELPALPIKSLKKVYAAADRFIVESLKIKCHTLLIENFTAESEGDSETETENEQSVSDKNLQTTESMENHSKERKMLKDLFVSREWRLFSEEFPHKAREMCKQYLFSVL